MGAYIIRRILISIPVLLGITIIGFVALRAAPGDPLLVTANPEVMARLLANPADPGGRAASPGLRPADLPQPVHHTGWRTSSRATSATRSPQADR